MVHKLILNCICSNLSDSYSAVKRTRKIYVFWYAFTVGDESNRFKIYSCCGASEPEASERSSSLIGAVGSQKVNFCCMPLILPFDSTFLIN